MLMQPQYAPQPAPPPMMPPPGNPDPYEFIFKAPQPPQKGGLLPNPRSKRGRIMVVVGLLMVLLIGAIVMSSLLSNAGKTGTQSLVDLSARQQELIRLSQLGATKAKSKTTKDLALTTQLTILSDQQRLLARLAKSGVKVSTLQLNLRRNSQTDSSLTLADQNNQFDDIFTQTLTSQLSNYQVAVKGVLSVSTGVTIRTLLSTEFTNASTLLGPVTNTGNTPSSS